MKTKKRKVKKVKYECISCDASGVYSGKCEPKGVAVICTNCDGRGYKLCDPKEVPSYYKLFTRKKKKEGIYKVRFTLPYRAFMKLPQKYQRR